MTNDELLSKTISYLRFPLTVGVVFIHFNLVEHPITIHGVSYGQDQPDWYCYFINFFSEVLPQVGVPLFFIISGFLFFYRVDFDGAVYQQKLLKRVRTLLIPYILWNLIAVLMQVLYHIPLLLNNADIHFSLARFFKAFFASEGIFMSSAEQTMVGGGFPYPINLPMWYVRDLMVMVLLAPVIYWLTKRMGKWYVFVLGLLYFFYQPLLMPNGSWGVLLGQAAFFFSWGAYYSIYKGNFVESFARYRYAPVLYIPLAIADVLTRSTHYNLYIHQAGVVIGVVSVVALVSYLLEKGRIRVNTTLANSSFFVYALHLLLIDEIGKLVFSVLHLPDTTFVMLLLYVVVPLLTTMLCVSLYVLLKRYVPSFCNLLTGGR